MSSPISSTSSSAGSSTPSSSASSTSQQQIDYLGYLNGLSPLPFDPTTVINALLQPTQSQITTLQSHITAIQNNETTFSNIANDLSALQSAQFSLTLQSVTQAKTASSSNSAAVTATAGPTVQAGNYTVAVNSVATATTAQSTASIGQALTTTAATTTPLNALNLNGTATAGTFSVVVDGKVQMINVDPTQALLGPQGALTQLQSALNSSLASDTGASATVSVANNKVQVSISGASSTHTISFGAAGDTSNFLSVMGLSTAQGTTANGALALASSAAVGVAQTSAALAAAGLGTALTGTSGSFTINGTSITWNAATNSLNDVINNINSSNAGVLAQYNSQNDTITLTSKTTGQAAIALSDTSGNFLAAMHLAPGTTTAQQLGTNASVTVNGATYTSPSNTITTAVPGLSINALAQTPTNSPATLTVAPDVTGITKSVQSFVDAVNKVLTDITATQQQSASGTYGPLLGDSTLTGLQNHLLTTILGQVTNTGSYQSLQDIGISTGAVGSGLGLTSATLTLDTTQLASAIAANPAQVAALFNGSKSSNGFTGVAAQLTTFLDTENSPINGPFAEEKTTATAQIKQIQDQITLLQTQMTNQRQVYTAQFSALATTLANLSAESSIFSASSSSSSSNSSSSSGSSSSGG